MESNQADDGCSALQDDTNSPMDLEEANNGTDNVQSVLPLPSSLTEENYSQATLFQSCGTSSTSAGIGMTRSSTDADVDDTACSDSPAVAWSPPTDTPLLSLPHPPKEQHFSEPTEQDQELGSSPSTFLPIPHPSASQSEVPQMSSLQNAPGINNTSMSQVAIPDIPSTSAQLVFHLQSVPPVEVSSTPPSIETETQATPKPDIGPYATKEGLYRKSFAESDETLPVIGAIKNGLVLELKMYLMSPAKKYSLNHVARTLVHLSGLAVDNSVVKAICTYITRLYKEECRLKRNEKRNLVGKLVALREEEFKLVRTKVKNQETPRKKRLRAERDAEKQERKKVAKKLCLSEQKVNKLEHEVAMSEGVSEMLQEEKARRKEAEIQVKEAEEGTRKAEDSTQKLEKEKGDLKEQLDSLHQELEGAMHQLQAEQAKFDPLQDDLNDYKTSYKQQIKDLEILNRKYGAASTKLSTLSTRNVNKRLSRRQDKIRTLEEKSQILPDLQADLQETKAKLQQTTSDCQRLQATMDSTRKERKSLVKKIWYRDNKINNLSQTCKSEEDIHYYETRAKLLEERVHELEDCIALCEDRSVTTFDDGKYTNTVRELIMELLSLNVSMSAVNQVIRSTLKKMANIEVGRLPSKATTSQLICEARVLADIEVGTAMRNATPEAALGNVIHGDGTTKFHKKYQNYQVTLPDKTSRSTGLMEMGLGDTAAVVGSYKTRMMQIAEALQTVGEDDKKQIYNDLITSVSATMTDQGPTMPQFSDAIAAVREQLLPTVVNNWGDMPPDVQNAVGKFGKFYCKMHPIINFAEEVNRTLNSYEDIATSGKNAHTLITAEAGVTRLVRTASKAFHHRGCDKSGVEDEFTEFLEREYGTSNHLVHYVGNRANILFEGAAAALFHLKHIVTFVKSLPTPNSLLLAVCEDSEEKLHVAELKALGITHLLITKPLWDAIKSAENVLSLNATLNDVQQKLELWKDNPQGLLDGDSAVPGMHIAHNDIYDCVMAPSEDPDVHGMCVQALQLICCAILLILERQCQDQLPGGKYWEPTEAVKSRFANVPTTNVIGERDFALLDMMVRQRPNARTITLEALIMWTNNGTVKWLDNLDPQTRLRYMDAARRHANTAITHYQERRQQIKKERWEKLKEKQQNRENKEKRAIDDRVTLTQEIVRQGGVWGAEDIEGKYNSMDHQLSNEQVRREIHKQLTFHQKILKSKAPQKDHFQLTSTVGGKPKKFTKEEMKDHLLAVVELNNIQSTTADPNHLVPAEQPEPAVTYTGEEELADKFERKKIQITMKLEEDRKKRAVKNSKEHLPNLKASPQLLVGKQVQHRCYSPAGISRWYKGKVIGLEEATVDELKTEFTIEYDQSALEEDEPITEIFQLLKDLKNNDLIILEEI